MIFEYVIYSQIISILCSFGAILSRFEHHRINLFDNRK